MNDSNVLYRYDDYSTGDDYVTGIEICLRTYPVIRRTPKGVWISREAYGKQRFVLNGTRKAYAYPTKEEALASFIARKTRQRLLLEFQLKRVAAALKLAKESTPETLQENYNVQFEAAFD